MAICAMTLFIGSEISWIYDIVVYAEKFCGNFSADFKTLSLEHKKAGKPLARKTVSMCLNSVCLCAWVLIRAFGQLIVTINCSK